MNVSSRYERPDAPLRHRTEINHKRLMLTQYLQKCQIALEIPDEYEEADGQLPRIAFKDHLCRYHTMARQDELQNVINDFQTLLDGYLPLTGGTLTGDLILDDAKLRLQSGHSLVNMDINELTMFMYGGNHGGSSSQLKSTSLALSFRTTEHGHSSYLNTQYLTFNPVANNQLVDGSWRIGLCRSIVGYGEIAYNFLAERYDGYNWESMHVFGGAQKPLKAGNGLLMDFTNDNTYDGSIERTLCVAFGTGEFQAAHGNHTHNQLHSHGNFDVINEITQEDINKWNAKLNRGGDETDGNYRWSGRSFFCTAGQRQNSSMRLAYFDVSNEWGLHEINSLNNGYDGDSLMIDSNGQMHWRKVTWEDFIYALPINKFPWGYGVFGRNINSYGEPSYLAPIMANQFLKSTGFREYNWGALSQEDIPSLSIVKISGLQNSLNSKQDALIAGNNIQIANDGKTISATGGGGTIAGNGRVNLKIGQGASALTIGTFTVNQSGDTDILLDSSYSGGGNEANLLSNIPHKITINNPQIDWRYTVGGDGAAIPSNKTFLVIESMEAGINNPAVTLWTPNAVERAFYIVNKTHQQINIYLRATENGTDQHISVNGQRAVHVLLGSLGISNLIGSEVSYRGIS